MVTYTDVIEVAEAIDIDIQSKLRSCPDDVVFSFCGILVKRLELTTTSSTTRHMAAGLKPVSMPFVGLKSVYEKLRPWSTGIARKIVRDSMRENISLAQLVDSGFVPSKINVVKDDVPSHEFIAFLTNLSSLMEVCDDIRMAQTDRLGDILRENLWSRMHDYGTTHPTATQVTVAK